MRIVTLRIKKKFFDAILSGEKRIEYRDATNDYYKRLFDGKKIDRIKLHYQGAEYIEAPVHSIRKQKTPKRFLDSGMFGDRVYAIKIGRPKRFSK